MSVKIAMVAGEASGDLLGSRLMVALKERYPDAKFFGIGGPRMIGAGFDTLFSQEELAVNGLFEVLKHLPRLLKLRRKLVRRIAAEKPDIFIGVDSPDFNLGVARRLKKRGVRTVHMVSPTVWAWRAKRIETIRASVQHMLVLLPFEEAIYRQAGIPATFIGHPLADEIPDSFDRELLLEFLKIPPKSRVITLLPGSRQQEVRLLAEPLIGAARLIQRQVKNTYFLVPCPTRETLRIVEDTLYRMDAQNLPIRLMFGHAQEALAASDLAIAASGTVTLEATFLRCPMVIAYKVSPMTYKLIMKMLTTDHIGLPNILHGDWIVPELLQDEANAETLAQAGLNLLNDKRVHAAIRERFGEIHRALRRGAAERAAEALIPIIDGRAEA